MSWEEVMGNVLGTGVLLTGLVPAGGQAVGGKEKKCCHGGCALWRRRRGAMDCAGLVVRGNGGDGGMWYGRACEIEMKEPGSRDPIPEMLLFFHVAGSEHHDAVERDDGSESDSGSSQWQERLLGKDGSDCSNDSYNYTCNKTGDIIATGCCAEGILRSGNKLKIS